MTLPISQMQILINSPVEYSRSRWLDKQYPQKLWDRLIEYWRGFLYGEA